MFNTQRLPMQGPRESNPFPYPASHEHDARDGVLWQLLTAMLDEVDYGMLLLAPDGDVLHVNRTALREMDHKHPLQLLASQLRARRPEDVWPLREAMAAAASRGLRRLLTVGEPPHAVAIAVVPLAQPQEQESGLSPALVTLGKRHVCEALSIHSFARAHGLTPAESAVLVQLCAGRRPHEIAECQRVAISTVRTQISSIRGKTSAAGIRELVQQLAVLPPLVGALHAPVATDATNEATNGPRPCDSLRSRGPCLRPTTLSISQASTAS